jgi:adenylate cyclase
VRRLDRVAVYGRMQGIDVFELLAMTADSSALPDWVTSYEAGLDAYAARDWHEAIAHFQAALATRGGDRPSEILIERCRGYLASPPADDWIPLSILDGK